MIRYFFLPFLLLTHCLSSAKGNNQGVLEELRVALNDVKQAYATHRMDLELLQEEVHAMKRASGGGNKSFEERVSQLESTQEKMLRDLRQLAGSTNQIVQSVSVLEKQIASQNERLNEVVKLKSAINSISKAIGTSGAGGKSYQVRSGDTLEKIARKHNTSIDTLKRINGLTSNTIIVDQQLRLPE